MRKNTQYLNLLHKVGIKPVKQKVYKTFSIPERFFLIFSMFFGILFVFMVPPIQAPDEQAHFFKAYQTSNLDLRAHSSNIEGITRYGAFLPTSVFESANKFKGDVSGNPANEFDKHLFIESLGQNLNQQKQSFVSNEGASIYSPVAYIPQAIGIAIGKIFNAPPIILIWLGRLANLVVWITLIYFAIKTLPFAKWAMVVLALNPVAIFLSASLSADVLSISLAFFFFSFVSAVAFSKKMVTKQNIAIILATLSALSLTKPINVLFAFLLLIIPSRLFSSRKKFTFFIIGGILLALALALLWNIQVKEVIEATAHTQKPGMNVDPSNQLSFVLHNPLEYIKNIIYNYVFIQGASSGDAVLRTYFGVFGWLDTVIPLWTVLLYILVLFMACLYQFGRGISFSVKQKMLLLSLFGLAFVGNITAMYLNYTPVGASIIEGVQGRYFLPTSVMLIGLFTGRKKILQIKERAMIITIAVSLLIVLGMTVLKIYTRYY